MRRSWQWRTAEATGIDVGWLLEGDPDAPPRRGLTARHLGRARGVYTRQDYEMHRALMESPVASAEEAEAEVRNPGRTREARSGRVTLSVRTMKPALLSAKRELVEAADRQTLAAVQRLLAQTVLSRTGDLLRWKLRRFLGALAAENGVKVELPTGVATAFSHVYRRDEAAPRPAEVMR